MVFSGPGESTMIDKETEKKALRRISIIEGQVSGLKGMIDERRYCVDVLTQISAIHEALRGVGKVIVRNHVETCVTQGIKSQKPHKHYDELMDIIYKLSK